MKRIPCRDATRLLSDGLERRLSLGERYCLFMHLMRCHLCRYYKQSMDFVERALKKYLTCAVVEGMDTNIQLSSEARERIKKSLKECSE